MSQNKIDIVKGYKKNKKSDKNNKYIDININGRLFPSWVLANFKSYKLPELVKSDVDPCTIEMKQKLRKYQIFLSKFLDFKSIYKTLLIYHGVGSGKTATTINIYNMLYNYTPGWNFFLLIKATLKTNPWLIDLEKWLSNDDKSLRVNNIFFVSYDSPNADKVFSDSLKRADSSKKFLFVIDEAHNFIRNVYGNLNNRQGRKALNIYEGILRQKKDNDDTRILLLSGTPIINIPFELALTFNLLRDNIFPKNESDFNNIFVTYSNNSTLNPAKKNMFQRRIMGLVSFYMGATPDYYAVKRIKYTEVVMSKYQNEIYDYFENIEKKAAKKKGSKMYKSYTRQACNFTFPVMKNGISGETRPRPSNYNELEKIIKNLEKSKIDNVNDEQIIDVKKYFELCEKYVKMFVDHINEIDNEDIKNNHTIRDDLNAFLTTYQGNYDEFFKNHKKSNLFDELFKCSAKMLRISFSILTSPGSVLVYTNFVKMEGIEVLKIYLKCINITSIFEKNDNEYKFIEYHGMIDKKKRVESLKIFNDPKNNYGKICKLFLTSSAGSEGINLANVRYVIILDRHWNSYREIQTIGRAIRMCSHKDLPIKERTVLVEFINSVMENKNRITTDQYIENLSRSKEGLTQSFIDAIKEVSIDCVLNKSHNSYSENIKCFQFEEESLLDKQIGPAYKEDFFDDVNIDNGLNSMNSKSEIIKVIKIRAVKELRNKFDTEVVYSQPENYWYNPQSGSVYDYDIHYLVGRIGYDSQDIPKKLDKDVYIISHVVPIPILD